MCIGKHGAKAAVNDGAQMKVGKSSGESAIRAADAGTHGNVTSCLKLSSFPEANYISLCISFPHQRILTRLS